MDFVFRLAIAVSCPSTLNIKKKIIVTILNDFVTVTISKIRSSYFTFGNVKIEEITVQDRLNNSSKYRNEVIVRFVGVAVDPVKDVECYK